VVCDVADVAHPDVVTVEALARLRLTARRHGWSLVVTATSFTLTNLAELPPAGDDDFSGAKRRSTPALGRGAITPVRALTTPAARTAPGAHDVDACERAGKAAPPPATSFRCPPGLYRRQVDREIRKE
jgi:hypothetical protein